MVTFRQAVQPRVQRTTAVDPLSVSREREPVDVLTWVDLNGRFYDTGTPVGYTTPRKDTAVLQSTAYSTSQHDAG